ncbi:hypothetical protein SAMN04487843_102172 [Methylobacterium sp. ap11]|uniref:DUF6745 domain-containing protein n=1 Tax=Methylobacterium sp. ap11 TaxID=1761799 RepID=UPI0008CA94E9|nr:hypothetical protein [Methylobacterium sp. ap11]SEO56266.1 hypothetical protein SAMN04487843_102172 [Methylobacterium sp. ap11]
MARAPVRRALGPRERLLDHQAGTAFDRLDMTGNEAARTLPAGLVCHRLLAPESRLERLDELACRELVVDGSAVERIGDGVRVDYRLSARACHRLKALPAGLRAGIVDLGDCLALETLPPGLSPAFLDLGGCTALERLPDDLALRGGRLNLRDCALIEALPARGRVAQLDIAGCGRIDRVPEGFRVTSWIDVAGSGLTALPAHLAGIGLRWRGVPVDARIAFRPHELGIAEILGERNAERRRVMLERFGFEAFMAAAEAELLDADRDPGGERKLLRVILENDEPLVCVSVACPSTGRRYFLRVPPHVATCRQAVAWTAGFDDPADYAPLVET